jgi:hypothetical protein
VGPVITTEAVPPPAQFTLPCSWAVPAAATCTRVLVGVLKDPGSTARAVSTTASATWAVSCGEVVAVALRDWAWSASALALPSLPPPPAAGSQRQEQAQTGQAAAGAGGLVQGVHFVGSWHVMLLPVAWQTDGRRSRPSLNAAADTAAATPNDEIFQNCHKPGGPRRAAYTADHPHPTPGSARA